MMKKQLIVIAVLVMSMMLITGCVSRDRGMYSADIAKECYNAHREELEAAAQFMRADSNIRMILRGYESGFAEGRYFTFIDGFSVISKGALSDKEVKAIKEDVIPAFNDERLESVRRMTTGFAEYAWFFYRNSIFENIYLLCKEIGRTGEGELIELSYVTDQVPLGDDWYCIRYSS